MKDHERTFGGVLLEKAGGLEREGKGTRKGIETGERRDLPAKPECGNESKFRMGKGEKNWKILQVLSMK